MKNLIKIFTIIAFFSLAMVSCGGPDMKAINEKIEKGGDNVAFSQKEYAAMADYLEKNYLNYMKESNNIDIDSDDWEEQVDKLEKKYPNIDNYIFILGFADADGELDEATSKKWNDISRKIKETVKKQQNFDGF